MTTCETPRRSAIVDALPTSSCAPINTPARPSTARRGSTHAGTRAGGTGTSTTAGAMV